MGGGSEVHKQHLKKVNHQVIGLQTVTPEKFNMVLIQILACLRPLKQNSSDLGDLDVSTSSDFLVQLPLTVVA